MVGTQEIMGGGREVGRERGRERRARLGGEGLGIVLTDSCLSQRFPRAEADSDPHCWVTQDHGEGWVHTGSRAAPGRATLVNEETPPHAVYTLSSSTLQSLDPNIPPVVAPQGEGGGRGDVTQIRLLPRQAPVGVRLVEPWPHTGQCRVACLCAVQFRAWVTTTCDLKLQTGRHSLGSGPENFKGTIR